MLLVHGCLSLRLLLQLRRLLLLLPAQCLLGEAGLFGLVVRDPGPGNRALTLYLREQGVGLARRILREAPGCMVVDAQEDGGYITPVECVGDFATFISRIRQDSTIPDKRGLNLWCVSDNLRKGAALNAVQIAETLIARFLKKAA